MIVVAAGQGRRFGGELPKQYQTLAGRPLLAHTLERLHAHPLVTAILPVIAPDGEPLWREVMGPHLAGWPRLLAPVPGGAERQASVLAGLTRLDVPDDAWVGVHDGARPLVARVLLDRLLQARAGAVAIIPAVPLHDTIKMVDETDHIARTLDRSRLRGIQTPQIFRYGTLLRCHREAKRAGFVGTDDASLLERAGEPVLAVAGDERNLKITHPRDLAQAEAWLSAGSEENDMEMRVGQGFDVHRFAPDRPLVLGGVRIPHELGLLGHSDADVLLHAIMDALLGGAAMGDIGHHFPDSDPAYRGADSRKLLERVREALRERGYRVVNVDATVICEAPRLASHIPAMVAAIAATLEIAPERVNVKATTTERLGFTGRREGIAAQAVVLLVRSG
ncbi:MAG: 2-C-methyl-D-erythritol 2,4-cyclodiphosphate synthase [Magnetococcales bacterium]|nr:2-C-methyl-D-erythritol 2,4-cyclodiphosphate synthase [Magnetococcales bacterium]